MVCFDWRPSHRLGRDQASVTLAMPAPRSLTAPIPNLRSSSLTARYYGFTSAATPSGGRNGTPNRTRPLTMISMTDMLPAMDAPHPGRTESETRTLGDLLYAGKAKPRVSETEWVGLVQRIAAGDQLALHTLYEQMHRIVFTLVMRIVNNRESAEELTVDVFHDVWRRAAADHPGGRALV